MFVHCVHLTILKAFQFSFFSLFAQRIILINQNFKIFSTNYKIYTIHTLLVISNLVIYTIFFYTIPFQGACTWDKYMLFTQYSFAKSFKVLETDKKKT
jgi:hypothetical protein